MGRIEMGGSIVGGEGGQAPKPLTMSELLRKARNSRKQARLHGEEGTLLGEIAQAVDLIDDLGFAEKRALLIMEAGRRIQNGGYRTVALLGLSVNTIKATQELVSSEGKKELFEEAHLKISEALELK